MSIAMQGKFSGVDIKLLKFPQVTNIDKSVGKQTLTILGPGLGSISPQSTSLHTGSG